MNLESTLLLKKTVFNVKKKEKRQKNPFKKAGTNIFLLVFKLLFFFFFFGPYKNVTLFPLRISVLGSGVCRLKWQHLLSCVGC